jgi:hypothetical protein
MKTFQTAFLMSRKIIMKKNEKKKKVLQILNGFFEFFMRGRRR